MLGLALGLSSVMATAGYIGGRVQAWTAVREAQAQLQVAVDEHQRAFDKAQDGNRRAVAQLRSELGQRGAAQAHLVRSVTLLEALRQANEAVRALDERNFGVADDARRRARDLLSPLIDTVPGSSAVVSQLNALEFVVINDVQGQRQQLLVVVDALESLLAHERMHGKARAP